MAKFILALFKGWIFHLKNCTGIFKADNKIDWFKNNMESVSILIITLTALIILYFGQGQLASDYTIPRFKTPPLCGENSKLPCK
jgi:hypothetical protein